MFSFFLYEQSHTKIKYKEEKLTKFDISIVGKQNICPLVREQEVNKLEVIPISKVH